MLWWAAGTCCGGRLVHGAVGGWYMLWWAAGKWFVGWLVNGLLGGW